MKKILMWLTVLALMLTGAAFADQAAVQNALHAAVYIIGKAAHIKALNITCALHQRSDGCIADGQP